MIDTRLTARPHFSLLNNGCYNDSERARNTALRRAKSLTNSAQYIIHNDCVSTTFYAVTYAVGKLHKEVFCKIYITTLKIIRDYIFLQCDLCNNDDRCTTVESR